MVGDKHKRNIAPGHRRDTGTGHSSQVRSYKGLLG